MFEIPQIGDITLFDGQKVVYNGSEWTMVVEIRRGGIPFVHKKSNKVYFLLDSGVIDKSDPKEDNEKQDLACYSRNGIGYVRPTIEFFQKFQSWEDYQKENEIPTLKST